MKMTANMFRIWSNECQKTITDSSETNNKIFIFLEVLCPMRYINQEKCFSANIAARSKTLCKSEEDKKQSVQSFSGSSPKDFIDFKIIRT